YVRVTYLCPNCQGDINSQYWLPPSSYLHVCKRCGSHVLRSGASIRSAWANFFFMASFLPVWAFATLISAAAMRSLGGVCVGFVIALLVAAIPMQLTGWIIGTVISFAAPSPENETYSPPRYRP